MTLGRDIAEHLRFYQELGISGVSREAVWRERGDAAVSHDPVVEMAIGANDSAGSAADTLEQLRAHIGPACVLCKLGKLGRKQVVFGVGNPKAELMFVGEAPGADEDTQGEPFVGRAGQLLTKIIEAIGLQRSDVYIANVIKCRPPGNRAPEPDEVATCEPFLLQQIAAIRPRVIVALGTHATHALLKTDAPISRLRGRVHDYRPSTSSGRPEAVEGRPSTSSGRPEPVEGRGIKLVPTFHPAFLLRSPDRKRDVWEDMKKVRALLDSNDD